MYYTIEYTVRGVSFECQVKVNENKTHWVCVYYKNPDNWFIRREPISIEVLNRAKSLSESTFNQTLDTCLQTMYHEKQMELA